MPVARDPSTLRATAMDRLKGSFTIADLPPNAGLWQGLVTIATGETGNPGMTDRKLAIVVLAAGKGTRMKSDLPKVMHRLAGRPVIDYVLEAAEAVSPEVIAVVIGAEMEAVRKRASKHAVFVQQEQLGTGHAVSVTRPLLGNFAGDVLVMFGDAPLITGETLGRLHAARRKDAGGAVTVLGFRPDDPGEYGRLVTAGDRLEAIVEYRDATPDERAIRLCNSGLMAFEGAHLFALIDRLDRRNAKGEYYLTDVVGLARADGLDCSYIEGDPGEVMGINSRAELAQAEAALQVRLRARAMAEGATLVDPATVWFSHDTVLGRDAIVYPNVFFGPEVTVGDRAEILGFCHIVGARIEADAVIGPFARFRPGTVIGPGARVGNFVEIKNAVMGEGAKANHLSYLGDAEVGAKANIGAGTIICNYDGFSKYRTEIGAGAFIGSNTALVAPVKVGAGAIVGAGSTIIRDVAADELAVARGEQSNNQGGAARFRARRMKQEG